MQCRQNFPKDFHTILYYTILYICVFLYYLYIYIKREYIIYIIYIGYSKRVLETLQRKQIYIQSYIRPTQKYTMRKSRLSLQSDYRTLALVIIIIALICVVYLLLGDKKNVDLFVYFQCTFIVYIFSVYLLCIFLFLVFLL